MARMLDEWEQKELVEQTKREEQKKEKEKRDFLKAARLAGFTIKEARFMLQYLSRINHSHPRHFSVSDTRIGSR